MTQSDPLVEYENATIRLYDVPGGYEAIIETEQHDNALILHEEPGDMVFEQLVERGAIQ